MPESSVHRRSQSLTLLWLLVASALAAPALCQDATLVIQHARVIVGNGDVMADATVVIKDRRIERLLGGNAKVDGDRSIDVGGRTVMPGLIDTHVHIFEGTNAGMGAEGFQKEFVNEIPERLKQYIRHGVTTVKSTGDPLSLIVKVRNQLCANDLVGPRLLLVGPGFTAPNGHPASTILRKDLWWQSEHSVQEDDPDRARSEVRRVIGRGVDAIKLVYHGGPYLEYFDEDVRMTKLPKPVMQAIIDEAHQNGKRVTVHTWHEQDAIEAIEAGADGLEHGVVAAPLSSDRLADTLLQKRTFYVPTLHVCRLSKSAKSIEIAKANVRRLSQRGVRIVLGTDTIGSLMDTPPGLSTIVETELLAEAGIPLAIIVEAATRNAADHLGILKDVGTVEPGKIADLIIVDGDPLEDISALRRVKTVVQAGRVVVEK